MHLKYLLMVLCLCLFGNVDVGLLAPLLIPYDGCETEMDIFCPDDTWKTEFFYFFGPFLKLFTNMSLEASFQNLDP